MGTELIRSAGVKPGSNPRRPVRPTKNLEETVSDIVAAGEQESDGNRSTYSASNKHSKDSRVMFGGASGSGKSSIVLHLMARMQQGSTLRVIDPKGQFAIEFFGTPKAGE